MNKLRKALKGIQMSLIFAGVVLIIMAASMIMVLLCLHLLNITGLRYSEVHGAPLYLFCGVSIVVGSVIALIASRVPLKPVRQIILATDALAAGDFSARINLRGPGELVRLNESFNHMAEELGSVEMLRTDFVNNFSHEFKTPIVSISGFAKVLKRSDLTDEERNEYLDIIISESDRLTELASNVLMLSKIENQTILTDIKSFNVSEQIRRSAALLEGRWNDKRMEIVFDARELHISGSEEMLSQVWINLLDNAIKFSPERSRVIIQLRREGEAVTVSVSDEGPGLSENERRHLFDRFYQGDPSHSAKGNGLGLTLAKKIIELHKGTLEVTNNTGGPGTTFLVHLPI